MKNWLKNILHVHRFVKPIAATYCSFNTRDIIFECKCGKRKMEHIYRSYEEIFPIGLTHYYWEIKEFNLLLNN